MGGAIAATVALFYLWLIREGHVDAGGEDRAAVAFVAATFALCAAALLAGALTASADLRVLLLAAGGAVSVAWGVLGLFTLGLPLLVSGVLAFAGVRGAWSEASWRVGAAALMLIPLGPGALLVWLALTR